MGADPGVLGSVFGADFDEKGFRADVLEAREAVGEAGQEDARHLQGLVNFNCLLILLGYAALAAGVCQPFGPAALIFCTVAATTISLARCIRWTIIGHHVCHGGFDAVHRNAPEAGLAPQYKRSAFGQGMRRFIDWLDWMHPAAWNIEHNKAHHYYLSEVHDPDVVQFNFQMLREMPIPSALKYVLLLPWFLTWRLTYYSPNTFKELCLSQHGCFVHRNWPAHIARTNPLTVFEFMQGPVLALLKGNLFEVFVFWPVFAAQWALLVAPMVLSVVLPAAVPLAMGRVGAWPLALDPADAALRALAVALVADAMTNVHTFVIIVCNHAGEDMYTYDTSCKAYSAEWLLRCAYSSVNFETGSDFVDVMYGWLNYQIEHHMFPDLSPIQYRKLQPLIKSVCKKHGVQYVQQNALWRVWQMCRIATGDASMKSCKSLLPSGGAAPPVEDKAMGS